MTLSIHSDEHYMREALKQALLAKEEGEIPVGAVVVANNRIIARAYNQVEKLNDPTAHAEMLALTAAANYLGTKYLSDCSLYVTLEPCGMCAGALYWGQLGKLVYAAADDKRGYTILNPKLIHPRTEVVRGPFAGEAGALVVDFFKNLR
ncbi:tRNA-specific adenosine-34 deaminase [Fulvivirga imtechensis AK7]|uniref:tRNA-specific adenosine deaminase n=1 Tax=Fulvivirga imtechensis AK7 TaxID=1237149 RepID=L8JH05_9BACT|nr:nucleoside deaminase [Fulvivirga imtechensis]ELR68146.1 tRNA-specific adenosine-34 deaminase [Fulvivirga imtechensis AK7]